MAAVYMDTMFEGVDQALEPEKGIHVGRGVYTPKNVVGLLEKFDRIYTQIKNAYCATSCNPDKLSEFFNDFNMMRLLTDRNTLRHNIGFVVSSLIRFLPEETTRVDLSRISDDLGPIDYALFCLNRDVEVRGNLGDNSYMFGNADKVTIRAPDYEEDDRRDWLPAVGFNFGEFALSGDVAIEGKAATLGVNLGGSIFCRFGMSIIIYPLTRVGASSMQKLGELDSSNHRQAKLIPRINYIVSPLADDNRVMELLSKYVSAEKLKVFERFQQPASD